MTHEKIFIRKDGTRIKVSVWLYVKENKSNWGYLIFVKEPDSDRWLDPFSDRDYINRIMNPKFEQGLKTDSFGNYVSPEEILKAKLELWQMIKPTIN